PNLPHRRRGCEPIMAAVVSWYGPLIDLSAAAGHVGGFVQLLASVRRVLPHQEQNAATGRTYHRVILEVGDDTRSSFSVSLWSNTTSSTIIAGDVLLLQNIKIVEFRNGLEGRAAQMSAVQILMNSKDLVQSEGMRLHLFYSLVLFDLYWHCPGCITSKCGDPGVITTMFLPSLLLRKLGNIY
uniref:OB domain-containing protein n=2 Tax=Aegilops tauschii subsp. strangulata TaxID=200361 RepID=A0A453C397_AEGTS